ncbi:hypothetical protein GGF46_002191 [Coemansia sp. RSA 552]|nr:hypothetical protein GGF46_002191 [Coemansia sp. RSA 552]
MMIDAHQIDCAKRVTAASEDPPPIVVTAPEKLRGFCARPEPAPGLWYRVPELSPTLGDELSPNGPQVDTPVGAAALVRPMGEKRIDPVQELRKRELPDLMAHDMPDSILQKVWALVGGLEPDDEEDDGSRPGSLSPNMDLLDPRNAAANQMSYTAVGSDLGWLSGDVEANVREASLLRTEPRLDPAVREPSLLRTEPRSSPAVPAALASVGQRYGLRETPAALLGMLQAAFVDSTTTMRVRQFWAALEGGGAGDFEVLAHLTIAAREAQVGSRNELAATESLCFDAARSEWDRGRVVASPGVVFGLLLLSEYGFQTGRSAVLWEFAQNALSTARKLVQFARVSLT